MQRVLVIEDDIEIQEDIIDILKLKGFTVKGANNGNTGLQVAKVFNPDLILCDIDMPDLSGYQVLRAIQQDRNLVNIPFIFCTSSSSMTSLRKGMNLGADDYVVKPFHAETLIAAVNARLKRYVRKSISYNSTKQQDEVKAEQVLTKRQFAVLKLIVKGLKNREIADLLAIDIKTVEHHRKNIMKRLNIDNFSSLIQYAIRIGIVN
jgi:DNA-binding NarL/FixJ family response regulator